jgi:hypothetical protein
MRLHEHRGTREWNQWIVGKGPVLEFILVVPISLKVNPNAWKGMGFATQGHFFDTLKVNPSLYQFSIAPEDILFRKLLIHKREGVKIETTPHVRIPRKKTNPGRF